MNKIISGVAVLDDKCEIRFHLDEGIIMYFPNNEAAYHCSEIENHINKTIDAIEENKDLFQ